MKKEILDFLVCPECKGELFYIEKENMIVCKGCGKKYPVVEDIPILLPEKEAFDVLRSSDSDSDS